MQHPNENVALFAICMILRMYVLSLCGSIRQTAPEEELSTVQSSGASQGRCLTEVMHIFFLFPFSCEPMPV